MVLVIFCIVKCGFFASLLTVRLCTCHKLLRQPACKHFGRVVNELSCKFFGASFQEICEVFGVQLIQFCVQCFQIDVCRILGFLQVALQILGCWCVVYVVNMYSVG